MKCSSRDLAVPAVLDETSPCARLVAELKGGRCQAGAGSFFLYLCFAAMNRTTLAHLVLQLVLHQGMYLQQGVWCVGSGSCSPGGPELINGPQSQCPPFGWYLPGTQELCLLPAACMPAVSLCAQPGECPVAESFSHLGEQGLSFGLHWLKQGTIRACVGYSESFSLDVFLMLSCRVQYWCRVH